MRTLLVGALATFALLAAGCTAYYTPSPSAGVPCNYYGNVAPYGGSSSCNTIGNTWFMHLHPDGGTCSGNCGMNITHHWYDQAKKPWVAGGALLIQFDYAVTNAAISSGDFHGYFCVQLTDSVTGQGLLFCWEPWRPFGNAPEETDWDSTITSPYGPWGGFDAITHFGHGPDVTYATTAPGSALSGTSPRGGTYKAVVTPDQFRYFLSRANAQIAAGKATNPAIHPYSTDPANYSVDSFQCGGEGYGSFDVAESCGNIAIGRS